MENLVSKVVSLNHDELKMMVQRKHETKVPLFIWGAPGIGKSDVVRQSCSMLAEKYDMEFVEITREQLKQDSIDVNQIDGDKFILIDKRLSDHDPTEIKGLQKFHGENDETTITSKPSWFPTKKDLHGVILFDELNLAPQLVQSAAYQIIHDRRLGKYQLPENISIVSCGNRIEDRANIYEMGKPLQNRFSHVQLEEPRVERWTEWAEANDIDNRVIGFLQSRPELLFDFDPEDDTVKAFATPRSVENVSRDIKGIPFDSDDGGTRRFIKKLVASNVGEGWANEFVTFMETLEKVDLDAIIENPTKDNVPNRMDLLYCVATGLTHRYMENNRKKILKSLMKTMTLIEHEEFSKFMLRPLSEELGYQLLKKLKEADSDLWNEIDNRFKKYLFDDL